MNLLRSERDAVSYLIERRLLRSEHIVDGTVLASDVSRRNLDFKVVLDDGPSFLVKQAVAAQTAATLAHEAAVYGFLRSTPGRVRLSRYLPHFHDYDQDNQILILPVMQGAESLASYYRRRGRPSSALSRQLGNGLAALHAITDGDTAGWPFPHSEPRAFSLHRPDMLAFLTSASASLEFVRILQQSGTLCQGIEAVRAHWRDETMVHGDLRPDNCVVYSESGGRPTSIFLVDWEFAGPGDPGWDVGTIFAEYLSLWLDSVPLGGEMPVARSVALAGLPLKAIWSSVRAFWQAYKSSLPGGRAPNSAAVVHAVQFGAVRMVQIGFEQSQTENQVSAKSIALLQLASNILERPQESAVQLLGFELHEVDP